MKENEMSSIMGKNGVTFADLSQGSHFRQLDRQTLGNGHFSQGLCGDVTTATFGCGHFVHNNVRSEIIHIFKFYSVYFNIIMTSALLLKYSYLFQKQKIGIQKYQLGNKNQPTDIKTALQVCANVELVRSKKYFLLWSVHYVQIIRIKLKWGDAINRTFCLSVVSYDVQYPAGENLINKIFGYTRVEL